MVYFFLFRASGHFPCVLLLLLLFFNSDFFPTASQMYFCKWERSKFFVVVFSWFFLLSLIQNLQYLHYTLLVSLSYPLRVCMALFYIIMVLLHFMQCAFFSPTESHSGNIILYIFAFVLKKFVGKYCSTDRKKLVEKALRMSGKQTLDYSSL